MSKQRCFILLLIFLTNTAIAQQFNKFKVTVGVGKAYKSHAFPLAFVESSYRISDNWSVGSRAEIGSISTDIVGHSFGVNSQFYFLKTTRFRPFIGLGLNFYSINPSSTSSASSTADYGTKREKNKPGFCPRVGFDFDHLSVILDYNLMTPFEATSTSYFTPHPITTYLSGNYLALKIGVSIGGGKKK